MRARTVAGAILLLTVTQLVAGFFLPQFEGKNVLSRLLAYPALMLVLPVAWRGRPRPWAAFAWVMAPFLVDVTGNTANLYDSVDWWDDANHLVNWFLLSVGLGLLLARGGVRPVWVLGVSVAGLGALLAVLWELSEYLAFIRTNQAELATAYTDTLGDEALGSLGSVLAAGVVTCLVRPRGSGEGAEVRPGSGVAGRFRATVGRPTLWGRRRHDE